MWRKLITHTSLLRLSLSNAPQQKVADALNQSWVYRWLPESLWPYAQLARWERPIGWQLLRWPGWWSLALASILSITQNNAVPDPLIGNTLLLALFGLNLVLFVLGAITMRGAGCTFYDIADRDIDEKVARTRSRPLPSGRVSSRQAWLFLGLQLLVGLVILLQFNRFAIGLGIASLVTVAVYPFMKRITWWPQLFLGFAFSWGALMGWGIVLGTLALPPILLYLGSIFWVIGYDTIYAHQDMEDDALVGVKSTARLFGKKSKTAIGLLYAAALGLFAVVFNLVFSPFSILALPAFTGLAVGGLHMIWQIKNLDIDNPDQCLKLFKSNNTFGWIIFAGLSATLLLSAAQ